MTFHLGILIGFCSWLLSSTCNAAGGILCRFEGTPSCNGPQDEWFVCCPPNQIPLPVPTSPCQRNGTWNGFQQCHPSTNIAVDSKKITGAASALIDGDLKTAVQVFSERMEWNITLSRLFPVYAVVVIIVPIHGEGLLEIRVRTLFQHSSDRYYEFPCSRGSLNYPGTNRHLFYCLDGNGTSPGGILTQDVSVTVEKPPSYRSKGVLEVAEVQIYQNEGLHQCGTPGRIPGTLYEPMDSMNYSIGAQVTYRCETPHFVMFGDPQRRCGPDGRWIGYPPFCREVGLLGKDKDFKQTNPSMDAIHDGNLTTCFIPERSNNNESYSVTSKIPINYEIDIERSLLLYQVEIDVKGYHGECQFDFISPALIEYVRAKESSENDQPRTLNGYSTLRFRIQIRNGTTAAKLDPFQLFEWMKLPASTILRLKCSSETIVCEIRFFRIKENVRNSIDCGIPEQPVNSEYSLSKSKPSIVTYSCAKGFRLSSSEGLRKCSNGEYWEPPPTCQRIYCLEYPSVERTHEGNRTVWTLSSNSTAVGVAAHYSLQMDHHQELNPPLTRQCDEQGSWGIKHEPLFQLDTVHKIIIPSSIGGLLFIIAIVMIICHARSRSKSTSSSKGIERRNALAPPAYIFTRTARPASNNSSFYETIDDDQDELEMTPSHVPLPPPPSPHHLHPTKPASPKPGKVKPNSGATAGRGFALPLSTDLPVDYEEMKERAPVQATATVPNQDISSPIMPRPPAVVPSMISGSTVPIRIDTLKRSPSSGHNLFRV